MIARSRLCQLLALFGAITFTINCHASDKWENVQCDPMNSAEASGIRILNKNGVEMFRTCQDGRLLPQTGFMNVTSNERPDFLLVTQVGAKASEATLYRNSGTEYIRVGWWGGWDIRAGRWHHRTAIQYQELEPTIDHPKTVVYFTWDGQRLIPDRAAPMSFHP